MLFSEVYSAYFNTVTAIIKEAQNGVITEKRILQIIGDKAFSESMLTILPAIKTEEWLVMDKAFQPVIKNSPLMPLTILQKRWLKSLFTDPRIRLFDVQMAGLEDVEPLFTLDDFVFFDRYADGDPYADESYIINFKTILTALQEKRRIHIKYRNRKSTVMHGTYIPYKLEYSAKDDKFRLEASGGRCAAYINLARIVSCELLEPIDPRKVYPPKRCECAVTFILTDERNALDRVMLHFSDCRKETRRMDDGRYQVDLWYDANDETEILIRILSFGHLLYVTAPGSFETLIKERLDMQAALKT
jgi:hypothetical protein